MRFNALLKQTRQSAGVSQAELARRIGVDHSLVSRLEKGTRFPSRLTVLRIARALKLGRADRIQLMASAGFLDRNVPDGLLATLARDDRASLDESIARVRESLDDLEQKLQGLLTPDEEEE